MGSPLVVSDPERRAPGDAGPGRHDRPGPIRDLRLHRSRRRRLHPAHGRQQRRRQGGEVGVHAASHRVGRVQGRPHDAPPGRRALPGHHRRLRRPPRQALVQPPPPRGRLGPHERSHLGLHDDRGVGSAGPRSGAVDHRPRPLQRGFPLRHDPGGRLRFDQRPAVPDLLRRRPRLGGLRADRAGSADVGPLVGGRAGLRSGPGRSGRLWNDRTHREGLSPDGGGTRERVQPGRGRTLPTEAEERRLHREGGPDQGPRGGSRRHPLHIDDRGSCVAEGRDQALPDRPGTDHRFRTEPASSMARGGPRMSPPPGPGPPSASSC